MVSEETIEWASRDKELDRIHIVSNEKNGSLEILDRKGALRNREE